MATKWGIVSCGKIAHDFVTILRSLPKDEHQVVAVAARNLDRAKEFASLHSIPKAYGSYEQLAKDPEIEIAHIGVLSPYHLSVGKLMLNSGKNVLMEKPMTMSKEQTQELIDLAKKKDLFLMEAVWSRFFPVYQQLEKELKEKTIGDIVHVYCNQGFAGRDTDRVQKKELGGGALLDIGIYKVNEMTVIFKEKPEKISALGHLNKYGVDESVSVSLKYSNGRLGTFVISTVNALPSELVIVGTKGQIKIPQPCWCPTQIITPAKTYNFPLPDTLLPCNFPNSSGLRYEAMAVRECLKKGLKECPQMPLKDSLLLAGILEDILEQVGVHY